METYEIMEKYNINKLDYTILQTLYDNNCLSKYKGMTITELMESGKVKGTRMTIYKKMKKLVTNDYIQKGCLDNHADTFYLLKKSIRICESKN